MWLCVVLLVVLSAAGAGRNAEADWRGARRRDDTRWSATDPEAGLFRGNSGAEVSEVR